LRVLRSKKNWAAATVGVAVLGTLAAVALASHTPSGFVGEPPLVTANFDETVHLNSDRVKFQTKGPIASKKTSLVRAAPAAGVTTRAS
jgi:hypothetical protein